MTLQTTYPPAHPTAHIQWLKTASYEHRPIVYVGAPADYYLVSGGAALTWFSDITKINPAHIHIHCAGQVEFSERLRSATAGQSILDSEVITSLSAVVRQDINSALARWSAAQFVALDQACDQLAWRLLYRLLTGIAPTIDDKTLQSICQQHAPIDNESAEAAIIQQALVRDLNAKSHSLTSRLLVNDSFSRETVLAVAFDILRNYARIGGVMSGALWALDNLPELRNRCRRDLCAQSTENKSCSTIDGVLQEVQRLYPANLLRAGISVCDLALDNHVIPCGARIVLSLHAQGRDPDLYVEPEVINPDRWINHTESVSSDPFILSSLDECVEVQRLCGTLVQQFTTLALQNTDWACHSTETDIVTQAGIRRSFGYAALMQPAGKPKEYRTSVQPIPQRITEHRPIKPRSKIAVVGSGIGGLVMATELQKLGHIVTVFESMAKIGGKCDTFELDGFSYNLGGHLVCRDRAVCQLAVEHGVQLVPQQHHSVLDLDHGVLSSHHAISGKTAAWRTLINSHPGLATNGFTGCRDLAAPIRQWLAHNDLQQLGNSLELFYSAAGYDLFENEPAAAYFLRFVETQNHGLVSGSTPEGGFSKLLGNIAESLDVHLGEPVQSVDRAKRLLQTTKGEYAFDELVITSPSPLQFLDASVSERELFKQVRTLTYYTVVLEAVGLVRDGLFLIHESVPGMISAMAHLNPDSNVYVVYGYGKTDQTEAEFVESAVADVTRAGARNIHVLHSQQWTYFPHVSSDDFASGFYERLDALQGQNRTWFGGSLPAFELTDCVVGWSKQLVAEKMCGNHHSMALLSLPSTDERPILAHKNQTIIDIFYEHVAAHPRKPLYTCLEGQGGTLTWADLATSAYGIANSLYAQGLRSGDTAVLVYPPDSRHFVTALWACLLSGVVAVPVAPANPMTLDEDVTRLARIIKDCNASTALTDITYLRFVRLGSVPRFLKRVAKRSTNIWPNVDWITTDTISRDNGISNAVPVFPDSLAYLQYTSGSTSNPKGVAVTHDALLHNLDLMANDANVDEQSVLVAWVPAFHDMGLAGGFLNAAYSAAHYVYFSPLTFLKSPMTWLQAIHDWKATATAAPNFGYEIVSQRLSTEQTAHLDLSSLCVTIAGGEVTQAATLYGFTVRYSDNGFNASSWRNVYGMAETVLYLTGAQQSPPLIAWFDNNELARGRVLRTPPQHGSIELVSVGCANESLGMMLLIREPDTDRLCATGQIGEVCVSGPSVCPGYFRVDGEISDSRIAFDSESMRKYLRTGDLGFYSDNSLYICGRKDNRIISGGRNYYAEDLEMALKNVHPDIRAGCIAVFGIVHNNVERIVVAAEVKTQYATGNAVFTAIREALRQSHAVPVYAVLLLPARSILKTTSGKLQRSAIKERWQQGKLPLIAQWQEQSVGVHSSRAASTRPNQEQLHESVQRLRNAAQIKQWLCSQLAHHMQCNAEEIDTHCSLYDYGLDSITTLTLMEHLSAWLGCELEASLIFEHPSIEQLTVRLASTVQQRGDGLVRLNEGKSELPMFCIHPAGGSVMGYATLAQLLECEMFGIEALPEDKSLVLSELAARYVERIRSQHPHGKCILCGYSMGGAIAHEMAHLLDVAQVILIDSPAPIYNNEGLPENFSIDQIDRVTNSHLVPGLTGERLRKTLHKHYAAMRQFQSMGAVTCDVTLLRATQRRAELEQFFNHSAYHNDDFGWHEIDSHIEIIETAGDHFSIMNEPAVKLVAMHINRMSNQSLDCEPPFMQQSQLTASVVSGTPMNSV